MVQANKDDTGCDAASDARWKSFQTVFTNEKAGMAGVDKEKVQKVVYEMSKGSAHFKNEERKQQLLSEKIAVLAKRAAALSPAELSGHSKAMDSNIIALQAGRDLTRTWIVVDMDAFFASVEERDDPSLKVKPMAVGGLGMISTANYVARQFGVRSAMPGFIGRELCPNLVFVKPNFDKYTSASKEVKDILREYDMAASSYSLDEAFLDVADYCEAKGMTGAEVASEIRQRVREQTRLTCSCGVAPNQFLAKICADINKPDGQYMLSPDIGEITRFMESLPIRKVPGIGKVNQQVLNALGILTCKDILEKRGLVRALFTPGTSSFYLSRAMGLGSTLHSDLPNEGEVGRKGIGHERTFAAISKPAELEAKCEELAGHLVRDMEKEGLKGKTLILKLKETSFAVRTRSVTLPHYTSSLQEILQAATRLLQAEMPIQIRLMGLRMANFLEVKAHPKQQKLSVFVKPRCSSTSGTFDQGLPDASPHQQPSTCHDLKRNPIPLSVQQHGGANADSVSLSGRFPSPACGADCNPTLPAGANTVTSGGEPATAPALRVITDHSGPDADPTCTGDGTQGLGEPSQGSIELSLRDWNQTGGGSMSVMPSLEDWRGQLQPSSHTEGATPAQGLQHYHSGISVTGPRGFSLSPRIAELAMHAEARLSLGEDGLDQSGDAFKKSGLDAQRSSDDVQQACSAEDASTGRGSGAEGDRGFHEEEGENELVFSGVANGLHTTDSAAQLDTFAGWLPGWSGRGMCGKHPEAADTVVVEADSSCEDPGREKKKRATSWTCAVCTFAGNLPAWLRCEICESVRGSTLASLPSLDRGEDVELFAEPGTGLRVCPRDQALTDIPGSSLRSAASSGNVSTPGHDRQPTQAEADSSKCLKRHESVRVPGMLEGLQARKHGSETAETPIPRPGAVEAFEVSASEGTVLWEPSVEGRWRCTRCGEVMAEEFRMEHDDRHLAIRLQEEDGHSLGGSLKRVPPRQPSASSKRRKPSPGLSLTLDSFLQGAVGSSRPCSSEPAPVGKLL